MYRGPKVVANVKSHSYCNWKWPNVVVVPHSIVGINGSGWLCLVTKWLSPLYTWNCFHWLIYVWCKVKLGPNYMLAASVKQSHKSHIRHDSIWIPYPWIISLGYEKGPFVSVKSMPYGLTCNITWTLSITKLSKFVYLYWFSRSFNHT